MTVSADLDQATRKLAEAGKLLIKAQALQAAATTCLQQVVEEAGKRGLNAFDPPPVLAPDHVREHRVGRPSILNTDPELNAFVSARIERMTFSPLAEEIARHFPPERRIGLSALHSWYHRHFRKSHP